jgi:hypothetical protein
MIPSTGGPIAGGAAVLGPLATAGIGVAGDVLNTGLQYLSAAQQHKWNIQDWNRQNAYNDPSAQMARLKSAGLNPNMVYGGGSATTQAAHMNQSETAKPQANIMGILGAVFQIMQTQAQTNNLRQIHDNLVLEGQGKSLNNILTDNKISAQWEDVISKRNANAFQPKFLTASLEGLQLKNKQTAAQTNYSLDENERRTLLTSMSLMQGVESIIQQKLQHAKTEAETNNLRQQLSILKSDSRIKAWEADLTKSNVTRNDPLYMKWGADLLNYILNKVK